MNAISIGPSDSFSTFEQTFIKTLWKDGIEFDNPEEVEEEEEMIGKGGFGFGSETSLILGQQEVDIHPGEWARAILSQVQAHCLIA